MARRPRRERYRGLYKRGAVIYFERSRKGAPRIRVSTGTSDWTEAAAFRDEWLAKHGQRPRRPSTIPTFAEMAQRTLDEDVGHLAESTTRVDRARELGPRGPIVPYLGHYRVDEIGPAELRGWWASEIEATRHTSRGREYRRSAKTGREYLGAIASVFHYARELGLIDSDPVSDFREVLKRKNRTQRGRANSGPGRDVRPIESPEAIDALLGAAQDEGLEVLVAVLLPLDGGLRKGEAWALPWGAVGWGLDEDDLSRHLRIEASRSRGGPAGPPKSGRPRTVALSRRLRRALGALYRQRFEPGPEEGVIRAVYRTFQNRTWRRICKQAGIGAVRYKDLRDTFASQLITAGVSLGYVSRQLGHADLAITAQHYARWCGGGSYRDPMVREPGEVPADFLDRLDSPQSPPTWGPNLAESVVGRTGLEPVTSAV